MPIAREMAASLVFNGDMVVMGGFTNSQFLSQVDRKRAGQSTWQEEPTWEMPREMIEHCAVQVDETHIMIAGKH